MKTVPVSLGAHLRWLLCVTTISVYGCERREVPLVPTPDAPQAAPTPKAPTRPIIAIPNTEPTVRVRIRHITGAGNVTITPTSGAMRLIDLAGNRVEVSTALHIYRYGGWWRGVPESVSRGDVIELHCEAPISVSQFRGDPRRYAGFIRLLAGDQHDQFMVINVVPMEEYIPGVLAGELFEGWHDAAFEAQAIAARGFAISECQQRRRQDWDVTDTQASQAYIGIPSWPQAATCATATRGHVPVWQGSVLPGYFSSCCGGHAATACDSIGPNPLNDIPPLQGHGAPPKCQNAPLFEWEMEWNAQDVRDALRRWGRNHTHDGLATLGRITSISGSEPNQHDRPTKLEIHTDHGTVHVRCVDFPAMFSGGGAKGLKSPWSGWVNGTVANGRLTLKGHGFGHGVGLCQYGAQGMAAQGASAQEIMSFYYPGVDIVTAW